MWNETLGELSFDSYHFGGLINVFLAAHIAPHLEWFVDGWVGGDLVGVTKRDFMSIDKVSGNVVEVVLAHYGPAVRDVLPHIVLPIGTT
jgi:hypothetical protein